MRDVGAGRTEWHYAKLTHQPQGIVANPALRNLPIGEPVERNAHHIDMPVRRRKREEGPTVVSTGHLPSSRSFVKRGENIEQFYAKVGERTVECVEYLLVRFATVFALEVGWERGIVMHVIS